MSVRRKDMGVNTPTQAQSSQLSRDALLIHGLALVFAGAAVGSAFWKGVDGEFLPAVAVGGSATFVLVVWSVILAVRALKRGARALRPVVVLGLCALEAVAVCLPLLGLAPNSSLIFALGLPVFVPVFVLASLVGVPVAWWRVKRAEKVKRDASTRAGTPVPPTPVGRPVPQHDARSGTTVVFTMDGRPVLLTRARTPVPPTRAGTAVPPRWKSGVVWYLAVTALVAAILLPCPLFLFCVYTSDRPGWQGWVVRHTPIVVGEATAMLLSANKNPTADGLYYRTLYSGRVARARLLSELSSTNQTAHWVALHGLFDSDRGAALDLVIRLGDGKVPGASPSLLHTAGFMLGEHGSSEQIRSFLAPARTPGSPVPFLRSLILSTFFYRRRLELLPELGRFCRVGSPVRGEALEALAYSDPPEEAQRDWAEFLADSDTLRRADAIKALRVTPQVNVRLGIMLAALEKRNLALQREILSFYGGWAVNDAFNADRKLLASLVKVLLPFLDQSDLGLRRGATWCLAVVTNAERTLKRACEALNLQTTANPDGAAPPDAEEQELIEKVREGANKWLEENATPEVERKK